jgi:membrane-associated protein
MEFVTNLINIFLHLDKFLGSLIINYGNIVYIIIFCVIFFETGLVITPFLPGDSLLFAIGSFSALGYLDLKLSLLLVFIAAVMGDAANYHIGKFIGPKVFHYENSKIFKKEYLDKTHNFYEKYGAKTIVIARFVPIVRTFAPFVAGVGEMGYKKFLLYNASGAFLWSFVIVLAGYYFGNVKIVKENFSLVIIAIIIISILPAIIEYLKAKK